MTSDLCVFKGQYREAKVHVIWYPRLNFSSRLRRGDSEGRERQRPQPGALVCCWGVATRSRIGRGTFFRRVSFVQDVPQLRETG